MIHGRSTRAGLPSRCCRERALQVPNPPLVKVSGGPYDRGCQHGRACGDLIRRYPGVLLEVISLEGRWRALDRVSAPVKREDLLSRAMTFLPAMEAFAPHLVEEIRGIADGAKVSFAEALLVNVRAEVMGSRLHSCCFSSVRLFFSKLCHCRQVRLAVRSRVDTEPFGCPG
jgi:hypothetical protein